jgi:hypothetical protein
MGKLTSTIGIPIKLLNEAQVRGRPAHCFQLPENTTRSGRERRKLFHFLGSSHSLAIADR